MGPNVRTVTQDPASAPLPLQANGDGGGRRQELLEEIERLRRVNRLRTQFINTAAHEFATPLTPLRIQVSLLRDGHFGPLNERQTEAVDVMERNMERLAKLVSDVLDVARLEAERLIISRRSMDLAEVARLVTHTFEHQAKSRGIELHLEAPQELKIEGDPDRLTQVIVNLLHNAVKFTPSGGEVTLRVAPLEDRVRVEVRDTGRGIKNEDLVRLFVPFSQLSDEDHAKLGGTGLGLSICQGIVAQHGGRIWCESPGPGKGTRFVFVLPLSAPPTAALDPVANRTGWKLFSFSCPECGCRDIQIRLLRNRYDCMLCHYKWR